MIKQVYNIFPTTIYVNQIENHKEHKTRFYKLYSRYDYEQKSLRDGEEWFNTTVKILENLIFILKKV